MSVSQTNNTTNGWVNNRAKKKTYNIMFMQNEVRPLTTLRIFRTISSYKINSKTYTD